MAGKVVFLSLSSERCTSFPLQSLPSVLAGHHAVINAETGSGKTLCKWPACTCLLVIDTEVVEYNRFIAEEEKVFLSSLLIKALQLSL